MEERVVIDAKNSLHSSKWRFSIPRRYVVAVMAFFGFCNVYALRVNLSVAIVAMTSNYSHIENGTEQFVSTFYHVTVSFYIYYTHDPIPRNYV